MTKTLLHCTACGAQVNAKCNCGEPYVHMRAQEVAVLGVATHPKWSDRQIAKAIGVSAMTVGVARKSEPTVRNLTVEKRLGADGKKRAMPKKTKQGKKKKGGAFSPHDMGKPLLPQEAWEWDLLQLAEQINNIEKTWTEKYGDWRQFPLSPCSYGALKRAANTLTDLTDSATPQGIERKLHVVSN